MFKNISIRAIRAGTPGSRQWIVSLLVVALTLASHPGAALASISSDALIRDAAVYARMFGVSVDEAVRRIQLQPAIADLDHALTASGGTGFGGLWIEHQPFRVMIAVVQGREAAVAKTVLTSGVRDLVQYRLSQHSLAELATDLAALKRYVSPALRFDAMINIPENRIDLKVDSDASRASFLQTHGATLPGTVRVVVGTISKPINDVYAGLRADQAGGGNCTFNFTVRSNSTGQLGIATAGHCGDTILYAGLYYPLQAQWVGGQHDEQWHLTSGDTPRNRIFDPNAPPFYYRTVTGKKAWGGAVTGQLVCKYGQSTGYDCGTIITKFLTPFGCFASPDNLFILVRKDGTDLGRPGDSGGPVFLSNDAYGMMVCDDGNDLVYNAENFMEVGLGVTVQTQ